MEIEALRRDFLRTVAPTSPFPIGLTVRRATGCTIETEDGGQIIDFLSGIGVANVGHSHPRLLRALVEQAERHLHVMVYGEVIQSSQVELARRLAEIAPGDLGVSYFVSSGAEAIEGAVKLARKVTGRSRLVSCAGAYHGDTLGALSLSGEGQYRKPFEPLLPEVVRVPFDAVGALEALDERVAAVVVEPIQGEAGVRVPGAAFLPALAARCREVGALCILDEVQTGFGRTGRWFAGEHFGVEPDILVLAKALGGGLPLGAIVGRPAFMGAFAHDPPFSHVTTFGGHPLSCAVGAAAIDVIREEGLLLNAERMGAYLTRQLLLLGEARGLPVAVRGKGLMVALEFPRAALAERFIRASLDAGLLLGGFLYNEQAVRLYPPLTIDQTTMDRALELMEGALQAAFKG